MAGALTISTLNNDTGVLATQNGMTGIAKAWVLFNGTTGSIYGTSFNISSVTRTGTGVYTINYTTAMPNTNYSIFGTGDFQSGVRVITVAVDAASGLSTGSCVIKTFDVTTAREGIYISVAVFSS